MKKTILGKFNGSGFSVSFYQLCSFYYVETAIRGMLLDVKRFDDLPSAQGEFMQACQRAAFGVSLFVGAYRPVTESDAVLVPMIDDERGFAGVGPVARRYADSAMYQWLLRLCGGKPKWLYGQSPSAF